MNELWWTGFLHGFGAVMFYGGCLAFAFCAGIQFEESRNRRERQRRERSSFRLQRPIESEMGSGQRVELSGFTSVERGA